MYDIDNLSDEIIKTAGFGGAIKGAGNFAKRTAIGSVIGAGVGAMKGSSTNDSNPNSSVDSKAFNLAQSSAVGALSGGLVGGFGIGAAKKLGNKAVGLFKKSDMEIPNDDSDMSDDEREVRESPNDTEKNRMVNSISKKDEMKQHYKDQIEKVSLTKCANYMQDIACEQCSYEGTPNSEDGRCPYCGAMSGIKPGVLPNSNNHYIENKEIGISNLYNEIDKSRNETASYY